MSVAPLVLAPPLRGRWRVEKSPARRVPSHGTHRFGLTYAIDLVPVGPDGRSAPTSWRRWLTAEPVEAFVGFGRPVLAPIDGTVVAAHDGEPDGVARRSSSCRGRSGSPPGCGPGSPPSPATTS